MSKAEPVTSITFTNEGSIKWSKTWLVVLLAVDATFIAAIYSDYSASADLQSQTLWMDITLFVIANTFIPLIGMGDRLNPKSRFDWSKGIVRTPALKGLMTATTGLKQEVQEIPFSDVLCAILHKHSILRDDVSFTSTVVQLISKSKLAKAFPDWPEAQLIDRLAMHQKPDEILRVGGMVSMYPGWTLEEGDQLKPVAALLAKVGCKRLLKLS